MRTPVRADTATCCRQMGIWDFILGTASNKMEAATRALCEDMNVEFRHRCRRTGWIGMSSRMILDRIRGGFFRRRFVNRFRFRVAPLADRDLPFSVPSFIITPHGSRFPTIGSRDSSLRVHRRKAIARDAEPKAHQRPFTSQPYPHTPQPRWRPANVPPFNRQRPPSFVTNESTA